VQYACCHCPPGRDIGTPSARSFSLGRFSVDLLRPKLSAVAELFHLTERSTWLEALKTGEYRMSTRGVTLADQGFIHCARRHQLPAVAELLYADADGHDLVVLVVDESRVPADVRYEAAEAGGEAYPHIYGPLPVDAVNAVMAVSSDASGALVLPV
jgi:uncharacterized protein (DUF952 family)